MCEDEGLQQWKSFSCQCVGCFTDGTRAKEVQLQKDLHVRNGGGGCRRPSLLPCLCFANMNSKLDAIRGFFTHATIISRFSTSDGPSDSGDPPGLESGRWGEGGAIPL